MLNYRQIGSGPSLVLQHGFLGGGGYWEPQLAMFGRHFNIIAPDLPGFAGSADAPVPDTLKGFAASLISLLDHLEVGRTMLLGHSMGSMVALQIALDYPERVDRLVLYGSASIGNLPSRFESVDASIERIESQGVDATADHIVPTWFVDGYQAPFAAMCREAGRGATVAATTRALRAISEWDVTDRLHEITTPALIICGDRDRSTTPDNSFRLSKALVNSELCIVPGCAHNVHLERPELFSSVVLDFLTRA